jgi:hypothetical protein
MPSSVLFGSKDSLLPAPVQSSDPASVSVFPEYSKEQVRTRLEHIDRVLKHINGKDGSSNKWDSEREILQLHLDFQECKHYADASVWAAMLSLWEKRNMINRLNDYMEDLHDLSGQPLSRYKPSSSSSSSEAFVPTEGYVDEPASGVRTGPTRLHYDIAMRAHLKQGNNAHVLNLFKDLRMGYGGGEIVSELQTMETTNTYSPLYSPTASQRRTSSATVTPSTSIQQSTYVLPWVG